MKARALGKEVLYPELSYRIMDALFEVHNCLGPGFTEDVYEKAVVYEFANRGIPIEEQQPVQIYYKDKLMGIYRLDLVVDEKIILELKAVSELNDLFKQQLLSYLKASNLRLGILANFGSKRLGYCRIVN
jgi:GxxExxY protein